MINFIENKKVYQNIKYLPYALGSRPRCHFREDFLHDKFKAIYPSGAVIFSLDFELAWGWRFSRSADMAEIISEKSKNSRKNIPGLIDFFDAEHIPVTWAIVGHLMLKEYYSHGHFKHPNIKRIGYFANQYWKYDRDDWFDGVPDGNAMTAPQWYADDVIHLIINAKVRHEIACHSFSHTDFSRCSKEVADSELDACIQTAKSYGINLTTFIPPGNLHGNGKSLREYGFKAFTKETAYELDYPARDDNGLIIIPRSICIEKPNKHMSREIWIKILKKYIDKAEKNSLLCHFWFHPSCDGDEIFETLSELVEYAKKNPEISFVTIDSIVDSLNKENTKHCTA